MIGSILMIRSVSTVTVVYYIATVHTFTIPGQKFLLGQAKSNIVCSLELYFSTISSGS